MSYGHIEEREINSEGQWCAMSYGHIEEREINSAGKKRNEVALQ